MDHVAESLAMERRIVRKMDLHIMPWILICE
jgi:hypothetical protein